MPVIVDSLGLEHGATVSKWPGKYVIGLTGNIATGKSVVRKMLEHLGAYGIDADSLAHRAMAKGAPGYKPVVDTFGRWILDPDLQVDRGRLGKLVFSIPETLPVLEGIIHPLVNQAIDVIVQRATQPVVVIEAIKLLETNLHKDCDSLWVSYAPPELQLARMMHNRKMSEAEARKRLMAQPPQEARLKVARVVIRNTRSFEETWRQVVAAWQSTIPVPQAPPAEPKAIASGTFTIQRGRPKDSTEIANLMSKFDRKGRHFSREDVMAAFGEKAFLLVQQSERLVGIIGWQVENLVARTTDLIISPSLTPEDVLPALFNEVEVASKDLQCEASLVFLPPELASQRNLWKSLGYDLRSPQTLGVQAWQEAAYESMPPGAVMMFKQLRTDRVMRPI